jgi:hypothetical protein
MVCAIVLTRIVANHPWCVSKRRTTLASRFRSLEAFKERRGAHVVLHRRLHHKRNIYEIVKSWLEVIVDSKEQQCSSSSCLSMSRLAGEIRTAATVVMASVDLNDYLDNISL